MPMARRARTLGPHPHRPRAAARTRRRGGRGGQGVALRTALSGQWEDSESGLHYNLNRYYDPETGQYLSPDPIGVDGGLRTHAYVHDPLRWFDPDGLARCTASSRDVITRGPNGEITSVRERSIHRILGLALTPTHHRALGYVS